MDTSTFIGRTDTLGRAIMPRRMRTVQEKQRMVAEASAPGASVAQVARRHGVNANLLFGWRRQQEQGVLGERTRKGRVRLLAVQVNGEPDAHCADPPSAAPVRCEGRIEITLAAEVRIAMIGAVSTERLEQVLSVLRRPL